MNNSLIKRKTSNQDYTTISRCFAEGIRNGGIGKSKSGANQNQLGNFDKSEILKTEERGMLLLKDR